MQTHLETDRVLRSHVLWAMGGGLIPIPLLDIAAVTGIQLDMIKQLAALHDVDYSKESGKAFISALTGSTFAAIGASLFKAIPGVGSILGGLSMSALSGASTYAVGQVAVRHFASDGTLFNIDMEQAKSAYNQAFEKGKKYVADLEEEDTEDEAKDVFEMLEKLGKLRDEGVVTDAEFEEKKAELLSRV